MACVGKTAQLIVSMNLEGTLQIHTDNQLRCFSFLRRGISRGAKSLY